MGRRPRTGCIGIAPRSRSTRLRGLGDQWHGAGVTEALTELESGQSGCSDLVVGIPSEDLDKATDAAMADSRYRLGEDTHFERRTGNGATAGSTPETGGRVGWPWLPAPLCPESRSL